jgi:hypothetical protein
VALARLVADRGPVAFADVLDPSSLARASACACASENERP